MDSHASLWLEATPAGPYRAIYTGHQQGLGGGEGESASTNLAVVAPQKVDGMEVHRKSWHCLNLFRPPYVCGQCHKAMYLWCMDCEGCGFCLPALVSCPW